MASADVWLVIGAAGHVGAHIVKALLAQQERQVATFDLRPYSGANADQVRSYTGNVTDRTRVAEVLRDSGASCVLWVVNPNMFTSPKRVFESVNVLGVQVCLEECTRLGVRGFVYASSIAVMNHFASHNGVDESVPPPPLCEYECEYDRTKRLGEECVLAADKPGGLRTIALRLGAQISDPDDPMIKGVLQARGGYVSHATGQMDFNFAGNTADAFLLAASCAMKENVAACGKYFYVTQARDHKPAKAIEIGVAFARKVGLTPWSVPFGVIFLRLIYAVLTVVHCLKMALGLEVPGFPIQSALFKLMEKDQLFSNDRARDVLGYKPRFTLDEGLQVMATAYMASHAC